MLEDYPCRWDEGENRIVDLDDLGERVLEDLWAAICAEYPADAPEPDPLTVEREAHDAFAEARSRLYVGREAVERQLSEYVEGPGRRPAVILGESGCGKSAFLATWSRRFASEHPGGLLLAYFVGASPSSTDHRRLLRTMCSELNRELDLEREIPEDDEALSDTLATLLQKASDLGRPVTIVIDALDQLSSAEGSHGLGWLPEHLPDQTRLVVSTLEGDCLDALRRRGAEEIEIPSLKKGEQRKIVKTVLGEWRRRLDASQLTTLLAHPGVANPLYIRVALEELRLSGRFEQLLPQIEGLAPDVAGLFDQVLQRLEEDHGRELVSEAFALLGSSRFGLSEAELLDLLGDGNEGQLPRGLWAQLFRGANAYLVEHGELIGFFHRQFAEAVAARYPERTEAHAKLATYFSHSPHERAVDEYPYQLQKVGDLPALAAALSDLDLLVYARGHGRVFEWMGYWRSLKGRFEPGSCYQAALDRRIEAEGESVVGARLATIVSLFLSDMGLYESAIPFEERSIAISERMLGPDHPDVAGSLNNLARLNKVRGDYARALPLYERSLAIHEKALGPDHPDVATSLHNLAGLHQARGEPARALPLLERSLALYEKTLGPDHPTVAKSLNSLSSLYFQRGDFSRALPLIERSLAISERALGPDHPEVATKLNNLASLYQAKGEYARALPLFERSLAISEKALGPDHPDVAGSLSSLGTLFQAQGDYARALPLFERSLAIYEKAFGPDHPDVAKSLNYVANVYQAGGDISRALPLLERSLAIYEKAFGPDHPDVATGLNNVAYLCQAQGDFTRALPLFERSLAVSERALGPDHPDVATRLNNLASLYQALGDYARALPLLERSLAIYEKTLGPDHPDVALSLNNLASLIFRQGDYARALPLFERSATIAAAVLGSGHPQVAQILANFEMCRMQMN